MRLPLAVPLLSSPRRRLRPHLVTGLAVLLLPLVTGPVAAQPIPGLPLETFLADRGIDVAGRADLATGGGWSDAKQTCLIRVLARLSAPEELVAGWRREAAEFGTAQPPIADRLVLVRGRATYVAPRTLPADQARLAAQPQIDLVRVESESGRLVDVACLAAPRRWARWQPLDEPVEVLGLPLAAGPGPVSDEPPPAGHSRPAAEAADFVAAVAVTWRPRTPLGELGMDYGLFAPVVDGGRLQAGDRAAFYALLEAVGRAAAGAIEAVAGPPGDIVTLIDPGQKWFPDRRGDPVTVRGIVRRVTRIAVDEPARREQIGADHYWELFVFVPTPPLSVYGREQDDYPIVCCVRSLPAGFPTGDQVSEIASVSGFTFKRYGFPLNDIQRKGLRLETPLIVGRAPVWTPRPTAAGLSGVLFWVFAGLSAAVGLAVIAGVWNLSRSRPSRGRDLPERIELPPGV